MHLTPVSGPAVVGLLNPVIVIPRWVTELSREDRELILLHEAEHLRARDVWLLLASALMLTIAPWCLPLWWQRRRLETAIELDCDTRVLARGADRRNYGRVLLETASHPSAIALLQSAWGNSTSQMEWRIMNIAAKAQRHRLVRSIPMMTIAVLGALAACDVADSGTFEPAASTSTAAEVTEHVVVNGGPGDPTQGDLGISGISWPGHGGPRFDGVALPPTEFPVVQVVQGGPAWSGGLRDGDVVLSIDGEDARKAGPLFPDLTPSTQYVVGVRRGTAEHTLTLVVGSPKA